VGDNAVRVVRENRQIHSIFHGPDINWDALEEVMKFGIKNQMRLNPEEYALMISQGKHFKSSESQAKMMEICYEKLSVPAMYLMDEAVLSAFAMGKRTCLIVDLSASGACVTPVVDGYSLKKSTIFDENLGGFRLDNLFFQFLTQNNFAVTPRFLFRRANGMQQGYHSTLVDNHRMDIVRDLKQTLTFIPHYRVSEEFRSCEGLQSLGVVLPSPYSLPDGTLVNPYYELCTLAEQLFYPEKRPCNAQPADISTGVGKKRSRSVGSKDSIVTTPSTHPLLSSQSPGSLADMVYKSIVLSDVDIRRELLANIVVVGGQSLLSGITQRLQKELDDATISQLKAKVNVRLPIERKFSSWIGGSILSICGSFQQCWVSKAQYDELGVDRCVAKMAIH
jgi:actin-related protein